MSLAARARSWAMASMGGIYGWILLAWGAGAIPSPILIARLRQTTGRYDQAHSFPIAPRGRTP